MSLEFWKSVATAAVLFLALIGAGTMLQVYRRIKFKIFPGSNRGLRRSHRLIGDVVIGLALLTAMLCLAFMPRALYSARVTWHIALASLFLLSLGLKVYIVRRRRALLRYAIGLGLLLLLLALGVFATSALWYFLI